MKTIQLKPVHLRKLAAITEVKGRALFSKNFIIMPIFSLGFTFLMDLIYSNITDGAVDMSALALAFGVLMNISMTGIYCVSAMLAEEKEKNTLRTLMTSSVNGLEFFLGSLIPAVLMTAAVNVLCVLIVRVEMSPSQWGAYLAVTTAASVISSVVGMIFGIFAKNQVSASTITTPGILIFMMIPMFSSLNEPLEKASGCLFTGIALDAIANIHAGRPAVGTQGILVLAAELIGSVVIFLLLYRKNGFER
ncbi:ABC transporter permease [Ruminococcus sp. CLA-AA-H200]|uniref:ABC transporter permease n=1 Tax=Ruminococcus turbiniformis TaxID=2881258 RepID=A0ABS8FUW1_9FIRM|nr:ABC transporter permease [Ruminococcus turbiniformis]MCC2253836.1 ABC transporter permease [Ruminococcus turbiniformis]